MLRSTPKNENYRLHQRLIVGDLRKSQYSQPDLCLRVRDQSEIRGRRSMGWVTRRLSQSLITGGVLEDLY